MRHAMNIWLNAPTCLAGSLTSPPCLPGSTMHATTTPPPRPGDQTDPRAPPS
jgi:hypothetical protein